MISINLCLTTSLNSPLFISSDGAHVKCISTHNTTTSSFVISTPDIREHETVASQEWIDRPSIPLLCRAVTLPQSIGNVRSDIATGELYAIAMSELTLPPSLPRIIITDSKSSRDILIGLREQNNLQTDRTYTRKIVGGVSKFIFNLFQNKFMNHDTSSMSQSNQQRIQERLSSNMNALNNIAKTWTTPTPTLENSKNDSSKCWNKDYWESHHLRSIWKVDSHQLNEQGNSINDKPRYGTLIPNLCTLSMNHHADTSADLVKSFKHENHNVKIAYSSLRFSFIWGGMTVDRHISTFVKSKLEKERLKRLKTKPTQGFIWRIAESCHNIWDDFDQHRGLFRSMLGFSRSHTRCLYKNEKYRSTCLSYAHNNSLLPCDNNFINLHSSQQHIIDALSPCMWCTRKANAPIPLKGNRMHAFLDCNNTNIRLFRDDMNRLLNKYIQSLFLHLASVTSFSFMNNTISAIEKEFLFHQQNNTGRIQKVPKYRNNRYLKINDLLVKWDCECIETALKNENCFLILEILGLMPTTTSVQISDKELGLIDLPWMGLIPSFLQDILESAFVKLDGNCSHSATSNMISLQLKETWKDVKAIILGKAIGLHRIIATTGKEKELFFRSEILQSQSFDNQDIVNVDTTDSTVTQTKEPILQPVPTTPTNPTKRKQPKSIEILTTAKKKQKLLSEDDLQYCSGITCGIESSFWCQDCNLERNQVRKTIKQCQRCGRFMTALRQAKNVIQKILDDTSSTTIQKKAIDIFLANPTNLQFKYSSLMDLLSSYLENKEHSNEAKFTNKNSHNNNTRIQDRFKQICKILHRCILHTQKQTNLPREIWKQSEFFLTKTITKIEGRHLSRKNAHKIDQNLLTPKATSQDHRNISTENHSILSSLLAINANTPNTYLGGEAIRRAVEVIRSKLTWGVYVAHAEAYREIQKWNPHQPWATFARMFSSQRVIDEKPHGVYIIPYFSGKQQSGHWHVIVIEKRRNVYTGWHLDSLGTTLEDRHLNNQLEKAFLPGRGRFIWKLQAAREQSECECGPRTIVAMASIDSSIAAGIGTEDAIRKASLQHITECQYSAAATRLEAALLIESHDPSMRHRLRRPRSSTPTEGLSTSEPNKRLKMTDGQEGKTIVLLSDSQ